MDDISRRLDNVSRGLLYRKKALHQILNERQVKEFVKNADKIRKMN